MAGNEQAIDEVVRPETYKQLSDLDIALDNSTAKMAIAAKQANLLNDTLAGAKTFQDYTTKAQQAAIATAAVTAAQNKATITATQLQKTQAQLQAGLDRQALAAQKATSAYTALDKQHKQAALSAKDASVAFGIESEEAQLAAKSANELGDRLKEADKSVGESRRNVGNYAGGIVEGFGKVYSVIRQAAFILPGIGISGIFLAIFEGIKLVAEKLDLFNSVLTVTEQKQKAFNDALKSTEYKSAVEGVEQLTINLQRAKDVFIDKDRVIDEYNNTIGKTAGNVSTLDQAEQGLVKHGAAFIQITLLKAAAMLSLQNGSQTELDYEEKIQKLNDKSEDSRNSLAKFEKLKTTNKDYYDQYISSIKNTVAYDIAANNRGIVEIEKKRKESLENTLKTAKNIYAKVDELAKGNGLNQASDTTGSTGDVSENAKRDNDYANSILEGKKLISQKTIDDDKKSFADRIKATQEFGKAQAQILLNNEKLAQTARGLSPVQAFTIESDYNNAILSLKIDTDKKIQALRDAQLKAIDDYYNKQVDTAKKAEAKIVESNNAEYDTKIDAINKYYKFAEDTVNKAAKIEIKLAGDNASKIGEIKENQAGRILEIQTFTNTQIQKLDKERSDQAQKDLTDLFTYEKAQADNAISDLEARNDAITELSETQRTKERNAIEEQYRDGKISKERYQQDLLAIDDKYNIARLARAVVTEKATLDILQGKENVDVAFAVGNGASAAQVAEIKSKSGVSQQAKKVTSAKTALSGAVDKNDTDINNSNELDRQKTLKDTALAISTVNDLAQEGFKIAAAGYANEISLLEQKKQLIEDVAKSDIDAVNGSIASAKTKQNEINVINARAAADQKALDNQIKQEKRKAAVAQKEADIAAIISKTAVAVITAYAQGGAVFGIPLAALVAAIGAAELAVAIATPIPSFAKGVTNFKGGIARYGEAGVEQVTIPGQKPFLTTGETIGYLPRGTDIKSNMELLQMARPRNTGYVGGEDIGWKEVVKALDRNKPEKQKRPVVHVHTGGSGYGLRR